MNLLPQSRRGRFVLLLAAALMLLWLGFNLTPEQRLKKSQRALFEMAGDGRADGFPGIAAPDYSDQWGHQIADVPQKLLELRLATGGLDIEPGEMEITREGDEATIRVKLLLRTRGSPVIEAGRTEQCTGIFRWRREGLLKWKLVHVEAQGLSW